MIGFLTNIAPIALGFVAKLFALKQHAAQEQQKLMMQGLQARNDSINMARDRADKESPMAALNRRVIIFVILPLMNIETVVPHIVEGISVLGFQLTRDTIEYVTVQAGAVLKLEEVFSWATMIIEFYFGAQLAKK